MTFLNVTFYLFALIACLSGVMMISVQNTVKSALYLVLTFFSTAAIWIMLEAEFLGIVLVLVYVGAVMVLFLFVVMMLDTNLIGKQEGFARYMPLGVGIAIIVLSEILIIISPQYFDGYSPPPPKPANYSNTAEIGKVLYTEHLFAFEMAAVLLMLAMIAAITLVFRRRDDENIKRQNIDKQVRVSAKDRIKMVDIKPRVGINIPSSNSKNN